MVAREEALDVILPIWFHEGHLILEHGEGILCLVDLDSVVVGSFLCSTSLPSCLILLKLHPLCTDDYT